MAEETQQEVYLSGDNAKTSINEDQFGLEKVTRSLAAVLLYRVTVPGYAIGIEGQWGSGKTSLANFVVEEIRKKKSSFHKVIVFDPWLIGKRDALLAAFFRELIDEIRTLDVPDDIKPKLLNKDNTDLLHRLTGNLEKYSSHLRAAATIASTVAPFDPTGASPFGAAILKILGSIAAMVKRSARSLEGLREDIHADLNALAKLMPEMRFVVVIDDMDRLDPKESVEILRLIKAVADFPQVVYLVCFDRTFLAKQILQVIKVGTGYDYLEKIFQNIVSLPPQEPFAIRRFLRKLLTTSFPDEFNYDREGGLDKQNREQVIFDVWVGRFIKTPRDAVRLHDAVKLGWPFLRTRADFFDYIWLQLVKLQCKDLYDWTQSYVVNIGSYRDAGRPSDSEPVDEAHKLIKILAGYGWKNDRDYPSMESFLPGISSYTNQAAPQVFKLADNELGEFERGCRLGSPTHWKMYFSFDFPSYAISDDVISNFLAAAINDSAAATDILRELHRRTHDYEGYYLNTFLERLIDRRVRMSADEQVGTARALADMMDEVEQSLGVQFGLGGSWRRALRFLGPAVAPQFSDIIASAASVNWLADVMRDQGAARGLPNSSRATPDRQWLDDSQFDRSLKILLDRFRQMGLAAIFKKPQPLEILFCWLQLGDRQELRDLISGVTIGDEPFLDALEAMRTPRVSSSVGAHRVILEEYVGAFMQPYYAHERLKKLASDQSSDGTKHERAARLLAEWRKGRFDSEEKGDEVGPHAD